MQPVEVGGIYVRMYSMLYAKRIIYVQMVAWGIQKSFQHDSLCLDMYYSTEQAAYLVILCLRFSM